MTIYWFKECSFCHQGRLIIVYDVTNLRLYLHCEECERGWLDPAEAENAGKGFLTLLESFETEMPSLKTIENMGWLEYVGGRFEE